MIPTKKISLTLIEYADPLIQELEEGYSKNDLEVVLRLAACVWNACVVDQWHKTTENVTAVRRQLTRAHPMSAAIVDALIARKKQLFGLDIRGITNECVILKNGEFVVRAEARLDVEHIDIEGSSH
ncbi:hypothetical protein LXA47_03205 [Massilia sp. P8910]|uniref:hypothetical protein n=1 Tax=Massilia antarctica TaxID=2765360 RepID=UPI001E599CA7|nr:hypothetical protein [Massilia antarctica]MCE3602614.1 hypothetical protein [Massilia antarctica]